MVVVFHAIAIVWKFSLAVMFAEKKACVICPYGLGSEIARLDSSHEVFLDS